MRLASTAVPARQRRFFATQQAAQTETKVFRQVIGSTLRHRAVFTGNKINGKDCLEATLLHKEKTNRSKVTCSAIAESQPPLTKTEEYQCFADVQDLVSLENKKADLEIKLGRVPTYQEWADHIGCSICHLYARIGKGRAAKRKMIAANLPLVSFVAKEFHGRGLSHQELCQEGALGLMKSTEKFDTSYDTKFSTYSYFWIRERMSAEVQKFQHLWMVGRSIQRMVSFVLQCKDDFRELHGRNPSMDELAVASKINKLKIKQAFFAIRCTKALRLNQTSDDDHMNSVEVEDPKSDLPWRQLWQSELKAELGVLCSGLSSRELQVLKLRYGLYGGAPLSLVQIAATLDLSHEAIRMAEKNALRKLRKSADENGLQHYLCRIRN